MKKIFREFLKYLILLLSVICFYFVSYEITGYMIISPQKINVLKGSIVAICSIMFVILSD